jgi:hypothetical protein
MDMSLEANENKYVILPLKTGYRMGDMDSEGLDLIGIWNEVNRKMGT